MSVYSNKGLHIKNIKDSRLNILSSSSLSQGRSVGSSKASSPMS